MLVYDICNEKSFENIKNWIRNIEEVSAKKKKKISIKGNLSDTNSIFTHASLHFR